MSGFLSLADPPWPLGPAYNLLPDDDAIGRDCVGALQFLHDREEPAPAGAIEGSRITPDPTGNLAGLRLERLSRRASE